MDGIHESGCRHVVEGGVVGREIDGGEVPGRVSVPGKNGALVAAVVRYIIACRMQNERDKKEQNGTGSYAARLKRGSEVAPCNVV